MKRNYYLLRAIVVLIVCVSSPAYAAITLTAATTTVTKGAGTTLKVAASPMQWCLIGGGVYGTAGQTITIPSWSGGTGKLQANTVFGITCLNTSNQYESTSILIRAVTPTPIASSTTTVATTTSQQASTTPPTATSTSSSAATSSPSSAAATTSAATTTSPTGTTTPSVNTATTSQPITAGASAFSTSTLSLMTTTHRYQDSVMYGWWGAQAGHLVRMADDSLWFVDDTGRNASVDPALNYYRFNAGSWTKVASLTLLPTIQQNTASIANGSYIYTYGVNIAQQVIEECYLSTKNPAVRACNNLSFPAAASNYIGATIGPDGTRVVWWTTTSTTVGGRWNYIYTTKSGWVGPITSTAGGYQDFSYALGRLDTGGRFELVGSAAKGLGGAAVGYASLYGSTTLGKPVTNWQVVAATGLGSDIVFDQAGGTHALVWDATSKTTKYFYKPKGGKIAAQPYTWNTSNKMRFALTKNTLYLLVPDLSATSTTMLVKSVPFASVTGPIDWNAAEAASVPIQKGIGTVAIYPESPSYSITSPSTLGFVINGFNAQGSLYYVQPH